MSSESGAAAEAAQRPSRALGSPVISVVQTNPATEDRAGRRMQQQRARCCAQCHAVPIILQSA